MFLLISDHQDSALQAIRELSDRGLFVCYAPFETALYLCREKDTGGVVVDCTHRRATGARLCSALRHRYRDLPIAALTKNEEPAPKHAVPIPLGDTDRETVDRLLHFFDCECNYRAPALSTHYLTVHPQKRRASYMGYSLRLSPVEHRLLYYLLYRAPHTVSADELCAFCFGRSDLSLDAIRVCVCRINRRAQRLAPTSPPPAIRCGEHLYTVAL